MDFGTPEKPCCPLKVLEASFNDLNLFLAWLRECVERLAVDIDSELPPKPDTGGSVFVTRSAGWDSGGPVK